MSPITKGFTLVESLVALAIVAVVSAILVPVLASSKKAAKVASSKSNLRQIHLGLSLYRSDYGGGIDEGSCVDMALPSFEQFVSLSTKIPNSYWESEKIWISPCRAPEKFFEREIPNVGYATYEDERNIQHTKLLKSRTPLAVDLQCSDDVTNLTNNYTEKFGIAVTLMGNIVTKRGRGDSSKPTWFYQ